MAPLPSTCPYFFMILSCFLCFYYLLFSRSNNFENFLKFFFETIFILIKTRNIRCQISILWRLPENKTKQTTRSQISSFPHDTIHMVP